MKIVINSILKALYMLYSISGLVIGFDIGMDENLAPNLKPYGFIYFIIWFVVQMSIVFYRYEKEQQISENTRQIWFLELNFIEQIEERI